MFLVIEIQKAQSGQVAHLVTIHETMADAESKFHNILMYAATTKLASHSATILTDGGVALRREGYEYIPEPEPEEQLSEE